MTDREMFEEMLVMQATYDKRVFAIHDVDGYSDIDDYHLFNALLDEIGELNHELKDTWCWWKFTQKQVDMSKVLEEYADVVHFCLCWINAQGEGRARKYMDRVFYTYSDMGYHRGPSGIMMMIRGLAAFDPMYVIVTGKEMLDLTWEDIYRIYCAKHNINLERVSNGY